MTKLLLITPMNPMIETALASSGLEGVHVRDLDDPLAWLDEYGAGIEYVLTDGHFGVRAEFLQRMPNLRIASAFGVGYDGIDTDMTNAAGVVVTHTPGVLSEDVATTALMLFLSCYRNFRQDVEWAHSGRWHRDGSAPLSYSPDKRRVGIVGLGRIGMAIANKLAPFQPELYYHGRSKKDVPFTFCPDLRDMAEKVEALICVTPGGAQTRHLINAHVMEALGPEGVLVNVGRGSVIDEPAMIKALQEDRLGAVGLDVFEDEPNIPEALRQHPRATLTPHVASGTWETRQAMAQLAVDNLTSFAKTGRVLTPVPECQHFAKIAD